MAEDVSELVREVREVLARERPTGPHDSGYPRRLLLTLHGWCEERVADERLEELLLALDDEVALGDLGLAVALSRGRPAERFVGRARWRVGEERAEAALRRAEARADQLRALLIAWEERAGQLERLRDLLTRRRSLRRALEAGGAASTLAELRHELASIESALASEPPENLRALVEGQAGASSSTVVDEAARLLRHQPHFYRSR